jgi:ABC-type bacteriocin/lantibiotic exporter with double-glycine peptidase domain
LGLFAIAAFRMMPSSNRIIGAFNSLRYAAPIIDVLYEEFTDKVLLRSEGVLTVNTFSTISLTNVSYQYPGAKYRVLNNASVTLNRGTVIGIVGASGSGKSTLMDLILGLLSPQEGRIMIDDHDAIEDKVNYQSLFGYVPQSVYLTDDSLRNNIAFGVASDNICEEALNNAIDMAQLRDFVANSPLGDRVLLGDRGAKMSGGQKQRVGIARALYNNPKILCFDEASSALDTDTETALMDAINDLRGSLTIVMVAHRLSTLSICDEVYEVKSGCVTRKNINDIYVK